MVKTMTDQEAKELFLKSDCSYFTMCNRYYSEYVAYRRLEPTQEQENAWRKERVAVLFKGLQTWGESELFVRLYGVASQLHGYDELCLMVSALSYLKYPMSPEDGIAVAETILGKRNRKVHSGLVYWAHDEGQRGMAILFLDEAMHRLDESASTKIELERRIQKAKLLYRKIIEELGYTELFDREKTR